jgi:hypothetical protein
VRQQIGIRSARAGARSWRRSSTVVHSQRSDASARILNLMVDSFDIRHPGGVYRRPTASTMTCCPARSFSLQPPHAFDLPKHLFPRPCQRVAPAYGFHWTCTSGRRASPRRPRALPIFPGVRRQTVAQIVAKGAASPLEGNPHPPRMNGCGALTLAIFGFFFANVRQGAAIRTPRVESYACRRFRDLRRFTAIDWKNEALALPVHRR